MEIEEIQAEQTWQIRHEVMWPDQPMDYVKLDEDASGHHFGLFVDHQLVSIVSVFENEKEAEFRKFATLHSMQGMGYGSQLLTFVLGDLKNKQIERIWCNARADKTAFYSKFGLKETDHHFTKGGINYVVMEWLADEKVL